MCLLVKYVSSIANSAHFVRPFIYWVVGISVSTILVLAVFYMLILSVGYRTLNVGCLFTQGTVFFPV